MTKVPPAPAEETNNAWCERVRASDEEEERRSEGGTAETKLTVSLIPEIHVFSWWRAGDNKALHKFPWRCLLSSWMASITAGSYTVCAGWTRADDDSNHETAGIRATVSYSKTLCGMTRFGNHWETGDSIELRQIRRHTGFSTDENENARDKLVQKILT